MQLLLQQREAGRLAGLDRVGILDQVAELAVPVLAQRDVQRDRLPGVLLHLQDLLRGHVQPGRELGRGRLPAQVLQQLPLHPAQPADDLDHVRRQPDGPRLIRHRPGDRLPDPPRRIRGELVPLGIVELLHPADQAHVALLDQVQEQHPVPGVPPGQRHHQPQVRLHQVLLGPPAVRGDLLQVRALPGPQHPAPGGELLLREQPRLDPLGQLDLLPGVQQRHLPDLLQVIPDRVSRSPGRRPGGGKAPAVTTARRSGRCRPRARRACHRDHPPDRRTAAHRAAIGTWLAGPARHTVILSRDIQGNKPEHTADTRAARPLPEDNKTEKQSGRLAPTLRGAGVRLGRCRRQGIEGTWPERSAGRKRRA